MISFNKEKRASESLCSKRIGKCLSVFTAVSFMINFIISPVCFAQGASVLNLPMPGSMISSSMAYAPMTIKGININADNALMFDFIIDEGDSNFENEQFNEEANKLIKYFLASLTVSQEQMWVNLSPYEKDRIITKTFGQTEMGRDLLAQDYMLKQLTASLMYPEDELGNEFWERVYKRVEKEFGTTEIPLNTYNKIWIVPETAKIYEHSKGAFLVESRLKVMLEEDYLALEANQDRTNHGIGDVAKEDLRSYKDVTLPIVREILIPEIEREVNEGEIFANLRQINNAMLLAKWYKEHLKESLLGQVYVDQGKTEGVNVNDPEINQKIYEQYVSAFKKGVFDFIKEDYDESSQEIIPRKYFSGGYSAKKAQLTQFDGFNPSEEQGKYRVVTAGVKGLEDFAMMSQLENTRQLSMSKGVINLNNLEVLESPERHSSEEIQTALLGLQKDIKSQVDKETFGKNMARLEAGDKLVYRAPVRLFDGPGSSFDLKIFKDLVAELIDQGKIDREEGFKALATISTVISDIEDGGFYVETVIEKGEDGKTTYIAPDYLGDKQIVSKGDIELDEKGLLVGGPAQSPHAVAKLFNIEGLKISYRLSDPSIKGGGLESSNAFSLSLFSAMRELTGARLNAGDLYAIGQSIALGPLADVTGLQGWLAGIAGNVQIFFTESLLKDGVEIFPRGALLKPLFKSPEDAKKFQQHIRVGQIKSDLSENPDRTATLINTLWTTLIENRDPKAVEWVIELLQLGHQYAEAIREGNIAEARDAMENYVEIRDNLTLRAMNFLFDFQEGKEAPQYMASLAKTVFEESKNEDDSYASQFATIRTNYDKGEEMQNLMRTRSLYSWDVDEEMKAAMKEQDITFMNLGAGGHGANILFLAQDSDAFDKLPAKYRNRMNIKEQKIGVKPISAKWVNVDGSVNEVRTSLSGARTIDIDEVFTDDSGVAHFDSGDLNISEDILTKIDAINKSGQFQVSSFDKDGHTLIRIQDKESGSSFSVMPDRGFTLTSFEAKDAEVFNYAENLEGSGGIFWMFPFVNRLENGRFTWDGKMRDINDISGVTSNQGNPIHGLVRHKPWNIEEVGEDQDGVYIQASIKTADYPEIAENFGRSKLTVTYRINGEQMIFDVKIENQDDKPVIAEVGGHEFGRMTPGKTTLQLEAKKAYSLQGNIPTGELKNVLSEFDFSEPQKIQGGQLDDVLTDLVTGADGYWSAEIVDENTNQKRVIRVDGEMFPVATIWDGVLPKYPNNLSVEFQTSETNSINNPSAVSKFRMLEVGEIRKGRVIMHVESTLKKGSKDAAMAVNGGIDLNSDMVQLEIQRGKQGFVMPKIFNQKRRIYQNVQGFVPIIYNVSPIQSLPLILGYADEKEDKLTKKM